MDQHSKHTLLLSCNVTSSVTRAEHLSRGCEAAQAVCIVLLLRPKAAARHTSNLLSMAPHGAEPRREAKSYLATAGFWAVMLGMLMGCEGIALGALVS